MTIETFDDVEGWSVLKTTPDAVTDALGSSSAGYDGGLGGLPLFSWSQGGLLTARGMFHGSEAHIPAIASTSFVQSTGHRPGDKIEVSVAGYRIPVRLDGEIRLFPTMTGGDERFPCCRPGVLDTVRQSRRRRQRASTERPVALDPRYSRPRRAAPDGGPGRYLHEPADP